jgi:hypothetical protein
MDPVLPQWERDPPCSRVRLRHAVWPGAHYFFSRARWNPDDLGIAVAKLVTGLLVPTREPVEVLIDDALFRRRGKRVWAASWSHDGAAQGPAKTGYGNSWVVLAVRVWLPSLAAIAGNAEFSQVTVTRYGKTGTIAAYTFTCLWYSVKGIAAGGARLSGRSPAIQALPRPGFRRFLATIPGKYQDAVG